MDWSVKEAAAGAAVRDLPERGALRTLYFHTGTHKTGSTALQVYLEANTKLLAEDGVSYACVPDKSPIVGNGQHLYEQLFGHNLSESRLEELLEFHFAAAPVAICSSEDLTRFGIQDWTRVKEACRRQNIQCRFVTFVRDIAPYYFSVYGQLIKAGQSFESFDDFCRVDQYRAVMDSLRCLTELFGQESMAVIHYEAAISCMDAAFMGAVRLSHERYDSSLLRQKVNRSLTGYEQEILSRFNAATSQQHSLELSAFLMKQRPHLRSAMHFGSDLVELLRERHRADLAWVNQTFFQGGDILRVADGAQSGGDPLTAELRQEIDRDVIDWCISKFRSVQSASMQYVAEKLRAIDWHNAGSPLIPDDFDPIAYCLLNPDLFKAGVLPYEHFITKGRAETGRRWKWPNQ